MQSESTFTVGNSSELSRTTSAAAVHVAFPSESGKPHNNRYRPFGTTTVPIYNRFPQKHRNCYSDQFCNFKLNRVTLFDPNNNCTGTETETEMAMEPNNNNEDVNDSDNNDDINDASMNNTRNRTPPPTAKDSSMSTTVFDAEQTSIESKIPSSVLVPSLPNSPCVANLEIKQLHQAQPQNRNINIFAYSKLNSNACNNQSIPPPPPDLITTIIIIIAMIIY